MPRTINVLGIVVSHKNSDFHVVQWRGDDTGNRPISREIREPGMFSAVRNIDAMADDCNSIVVLHDISHIEHPKVMKKKQKEKALADEASKKDKLTRDFSQLVSAYQRLGQKKTDQRDAVCQLILRGEDDSFGLNRDDAQEIDKITQIDNNGCSSLTALDELMREEFERIRARRPLVEPIVVPNDEVNLMPVDNVIEADDLHNHGQHNEPALINPFELLDNDEDIIIPSPIPARCERLLDDNNALPYVQINEADVDLIEALRLSMIVDNSDDANQRLIDNMIQDAGFEAENISILELSNQNQTNVNSNVPRLIPVAAPVPPRPLQNVKMMVIGGFIAALGISAVAYAFIALHAPFLVTACVVVLGVASTYAGIRFFSKGANPPPPPAGDASFSTDVLSNRMH